MPDLRNLRARILAFVFRFFDEHLVKQRFDVGLVLRYPLTARDQPTSGLRMVSVGKRPKSLSTVHNSRTPCARQIAATRASWTCAPAIRPCSSRLRRSEERRVGKECR